MKMYNTQLKELEKLLKNYLLTLEVAINDIEELTIEEKIKYSIITAAKDIINNDF